MTSDESVKSIWSALFSRRGGSGETTRLWVHWDDDTRAAALGSTILDAEELPVVKPVGFTQKRKTQLNELDIALSSGRSLRIAVDLVGVPDAEISRRARDGSLSSSERKRYITEEKARGIRHSGQKK